MRINPTIRERQGGLTLIEMMVSTTCLLVIILGLTAMFIQTQRAFKLGLKQNDVSDNGRTIVDLMARDMSQISDLQNVNFTNSCTFYFSPGQYLPPIVQMDNSIPPQPIRTNRLQFIFFVDRIGNAWSSVGYAFLPSIPSSGVGIGVGTLYRFAPGPLTGGSTNRLPPVTPECILALSNQYVTFATATNWMTNRVADGVVHLQIRAYDTNGFEISNRFGNFPMLGPDTVEYSTFPIVTNNFLTGVPTIGTNLPASLELELGLLEPEALEHLRALGNYTAQTNYLASRAGQVQVYRQQIPIKTVTR